MPRASPIAARAHQRDLDVIGLAARAERAARGVVEQPAGRHVATRARREGRKHAAIRQRDLARRMQADAPERARARSAGMRAGAADVPAVGRRDGRPDAIETDDRRAWLATRRPALGAFRRARLPDGRGGVRGTPRQRAPPLGAAPARTARRDGRPSRDGRAEVLVGSPVAAADRIPPERRAAKGRRRAHAGNACAAALVACRVRAVLVPPARRGRAAGAASRVDQGGPSVRDPEVDRCRPISGDVREEAAGHHGGDEEE